MKSLKKLIIMGCLVLLVTGCGVFTIANKKVEYLKGKYNIEISIKDYGKMELELDADIAPITVTNFMELVREGFYNNNRITRVDKDFVIQGGNTDMTKEMITGEFLANGIDNSISHTKGVISMARSGGQTDGYDTASTQFFIVTNDKAVDSLDNYYAGFGKVTKGLEVLDKLNKKKFEANSMGFISNESDMPVIEYIKEIEK